MRAALLDLSIYLLTVRQAGLPLNQPYDAGWSVSSCPYRPTSLSGVSSVASLLSFRSNADPFDSHQLSDKSGCPSTPGWHAHAKLHPSLPDAYPIAFRRAIRANGRARALGARSRANMAALALAMSATAYRSRVERIDSFYRSAIRSSEPVITQPRHGSEEPEELPSRPGERRAVDASA